MSRELKTYFIDKLGDKIVIVHGGAGTWSRITERTLIEHILRKLEEAAVAGYRELAKGNLVNGVVESIAVLEDSGLFNAGIGSVLSYTGSLEMDAGLMTGDLRAAGIGATTYPRNPIRLAALVLEKLNHVLIVGNAADNLAEKFGLEKHPGPSKRAIERWKNAHKSIKEGVGPSWAKAIMELYGADTVGAAAVLGKNTASGASTGGIILKHPGRVGDSAIPGTGFYAINGIGACSATGIGETIILGRPCIYALELVSNGVPVEDAVRAAISRHTRLFGRNTAGIIVATCRGEAAAAINTEAMPIAVASDRIQVSLFIGP